MISAAPRQAHEPKALDSLIDDVLITSHNADKILGANCLLVNLAKMNPKVKVVIPPISSF